MGLMLCWEGVCKDTSPSGVYGLVQHILNVLMTVCTEEGVTVPGGVMEEVTFDLGSDGGIRAFLKEKVGRLFWQWNHKCQGTEA